MVREMVTDCGVSPWASHPQEPGCKCLLSARLLGWLLAIKSRCFSKLASYFLSSCKSPELVLYPQLIVWLIWFGPSNMDLGGFGGLCLEQVTETMWFSPRDDVRSGYTSTKALHFNVHVLNNSFLWALQDSSDFPCDAKNLITCKRNIICQCLTLKRRIDGGSFCSV